MSASRASEALACAGVSKVFGAGASVVPALRGVDLSVHEGEVTLLVGPSGCGKTTLLYVCTGLLDPTAGRVRVLNKDLAMMTAAKKTSFRRDNVGIVFQQLNLMPTLSAAENVTVPFVVRGISVREALPLARELLGELGIARCCDCLPDQLSTGQQQRVAIARALVHEPRIVVCDEPTSALDSDMGRTVMRLLKDVALRPGRTVLVVTHDTRLYEFADRVAKMEDGRIIAIDSLPSCSLQARSNPICS